MRNDDNDDGPFSDDEVDLSFVDDEEMEHRRELAAVISNMKSQLSNYAAERESDIQGMSGRHLIRTEYDDDDELESEDEDGVRRRRKSSDPAEEIIEILEGAEKAAKQALEAAASGLQPFNLEHMRHSPRDPVSLRRSPKGINTDDDDDRVSDPRSSSSKTQTATINLSRGNLTNITNVPSVSSVGLVGAGGRSLLNSILQDDADDLTDHEHEEDFSMYENKSGLAEDMKFLASMPELCDVTFLVGETREPVCAVKAVLASRSRVFQKLLYHHRQKSPTLTPVPANAATSSASSRESSNEEHSHAKGRRESVVKETKFDGKSSKRKSKKIKESRKDSSSGTVSEKKDNKLKLFLKRSSEPFLDGLPFSQQSAPAATQHQTMIIEEFEPDVFRQLIEYIHTGCVTLQARTLLGLMNAADYYGLEELRRGCMNFVSCCITVDTVCALLASAERYIQYKCTKSLVQRVSPKTATIFQSRNRNTRVNERVWCQEQNIS